MKTGRLERGFSLVEVMVVASILAVIALGSAQMITQQQGLATYLEDRLSHLQLQNQLQLQLSYPAACVATMAGLTLNLNTSQTTPIAVIRNNQGQVLQTSNADIGQLRVGQIMLRNRSVPSLGGSGLIDIEVPSERIRKVGGTSHFQPMTISVSASTNPAGQITSCGVSTGYEVIAAGTGFDGQTGNEACAARGKLCTYVSSLNFMHAGCDETHCQKVCATWYNRSLPGVPNTATSPTTDPGRPPIHSCDARIGTHQTYWHDNVLECRGHFSAHCN